MPLTDDQTPVPSTAVADIRPRYVQPEPCGWIVAVGDDIEHAALYNLSEKDKAFDAARRWSANITAVYPALALK